MPRLSATAAALTTVLTVGLLTGLAGCSSQGVTRLEPAASEIDFVSPALRGAENGLEMHWWLAEGSAASLRAAIARYAEPDPSLDSDTRARLAECGLRVVRTPIADIASIRESLSVRGRTDRKWLGQAPWWIEALRGALAGNAVVDHLGDIVTLPSGRLRVLTRAWTSPTASGPVLRADVALQHLPRLSELLPSLSERETRASLQPQHQGDVFDETVMSLEMQEGYAYLLVCDQRDAVWPGEEVAMDPRERLYAPQSVSDDDQIGPPTLRVPTLGERLLRRPGTPFSDASAVTAVVVFTPRLPGEFRLLP